VQSDVPLTPPSQVMQKYDALFSQGGRYLLDGKDFQDTKPNDQQLEESRLLIDSYSHTEQVAILIDVVELALTRADEQLAAVDIGWTMPPPQADPADVPTNARAISAAVWLNNFAFAFIRELIRVRPNVKPEVEAALERHNRVYGFFHRLGPGLRYQNLGLSEYYEFHGDAMTHEWDSLKRELKYL
jgi:hypothetical protein